MKSFVAPIVLSLTGTPMKVAVAPQMPVFSPATAALPALSGIEPLLAAGLPSLQGVAAITAASQEGARPRVAASAQLQAAASLPQDDKRDAAADRAFYEKVFSGAWASDARAPQLEPAPVPAPEAPLESLKADVEKLLEHLSAERSSWRGDARRAQALQERIADVAVNRGIPRRVPKGLFGSEVQIEPLDPDLLAQLGELSATIGRIGRSPRVDFTSDVSDLFYSFNVLAGRAASRADFAKDIAWLYGTYRLGER